MWNYQNNRGSLWIRNQAGQPIAVIEAVWIKGDGSSVVWKVTGFEGYESIRREYPTKAEARAFVEGLEQAGKMEP